MIRFVELFCKDLRKVRRLWLLIGATVVLFLAGARVCAALTGAPPGDMTAFVVYVLMTAASLLFPAFVVAGKGGAGRARFATERPVGPGVVLAAKLVAVLIATSGTWLLALLTRAALMQREPLHDLGLLADPYQWMLYLWLTLATFVLSLGVRRPIVAFLLGLAFGGVCYWLTTYPFLIDCPPVRPDEGAFRAGRWGYALCGGILLLGAYVLLRREWRTARRNGALATVVVATGVAVAIGGAMVSWRLVSLLQLKARSATNVWRIHPSPDGRTVAFGAEFRAGGRSVSRAAVLDVATGRARIVAPFRRYVQCKWAAEPGGPLVLEPDGSDGFHCNPGMPIGIQLDVALRRFSFPRARPTVYYPDSGQTAAGPVCTETDGFFPSLQAIKGGEAYLFDHGSLVRAFSLDNPAARNIPLPAGVEGLLLDKDMTCPLAYRTRGFFEPRPPSETDRRYAYDTGARAWRTLAAPPGMDIIDVSPSFQLLVERGPAGAKPGVRGWGELFLASPDGTIQKQLGRRAFGYCFSPNGRAVVFGAELRRPSPQPGGAAVVLYDIEAERLVGICRVTGMEVVSRLDFSPDSRRLLMRTRAGFLAAFDIKSGAQQILARSTEENLLWAQWLGNDDLLLFPLVKYRGRAFFRVRWDGSEAEMLFPEKRPLTEAERRRWLVEEGETPD